jgi:hypothetical protein
VSLCSIGLSHPALYSELASCFVAGVASRAFCVDAYHGDAMVPLADVFNHKVGRGWVEDR